MIHASMNCFTAAFTASWSSCDNLSGSLYRGIVVDDHCIL